ncbi:RAB25 [Symbiodinium sp. CCMP2592]|nr:RAB25 [Symbiodinium sp. CCMP2592]
MTNNATKSQEDLMQLFGKMGVTAEKSEIMTSSIAAGDYLCSKGLQGRKVYLSGKLRAEVELPETASVADILAAIQHEGTLDPTLKRTLVLEGRALEESELLRDLDLQSPPPVQMQEILQVQHAERVMSLPNQCRLVQFAVVGESGVGKTSLAFRYATNHSQRGQAMVEIPFARVLADDTPLRVLLRDTSRPTELPSSLFLLGMDALLLVIDLTDPQSLRALHRWVQHDTVQAMPAKLLIGNKADMTAQRKVSRKEAEQFAATNCLAYFETSAEDGTGVDAAMDYAIFHALSKLKSLPSPQLAAEPARTFLGCNLQ